MRGRTLGVVLIASITLAACDNTAEETPQERSEAAGQGDASPGASAATDSGPDQPKAGAWFTDTKTNPVDDTTTVTAILDAKEGRSRFDGPVSLFIRCQSNTTEMYANWRSYLGNDSNSVYEDWKRVTVRVGSEQAKEERWDVSTDSQATFAPGSPIALLKRMVEADQLVLQTVPYNESPITAVFDLTGIREAVSPVAKECGWEL